MVDILITKIIVLRGESRDLPHDLDPAEIAYSTDEGRVFIGCDPISGQPQYGRTTFPYGNVEVLTENSTDLFAKLHGDRMKEGGGSDYYDATLQASRETWTTVMVPRDGELNEYRIHDPASVTAFIDYALATTKGIPIRMGNMHLTHYVDYEAEPHLMDNGIIRRDINVSEEDQYDPFLVLGTVYFRFKVDGPLNAPYLAFQYRNLTDESLRLRFKMSRPIGTHYDEPIPEKPTVIPNGYVRKKIIIRSSIHGEYHPPVVGSMAVVIVISGASVAESGVQHGGFDAIEASDVVISNGVLKLKSSLIVSETSDTLTSSCIIRHEAASGVIEAADVTTAIARLLIKAKTTGNVFALHNWGANPFRMTITDVGLTGPFGTAPNALSMTETTETGWHGYNRSAWGSIDSDAVSTYTVYVKPNGRNYINIFSYSYDGASNYDTAQYVDSFFSLVGDGEIYHKDSGGAFRYRGSSVENIGGGWYKLTLSVSSTISTNVLTEVYALNAMGTSGNYTGDGISGITIWGDTQTYDPLLEDDDTVVSLSTKT